MSHSKSLGYLYGILAAGFYGLNPLFALPLFHAGMDTLSVLFWRYSLSVPLLALLMVFEHSDFRLSKTEGLQLTFLGGLMAASSILLYLSYNYMDAGLASTILFVYPIVTAVLMAVVFHEKVASMVWGCLALATAGICVLCEINGAAHVSIAGVLLSLFSALVYAVYLVFINKGHITHCPPAKVTFFVLLSATIMLGMMLLIRGHVDVPQGIQWGYSFGSALLPTALSLVLTTLAIQSVGSTQTAILGAMEPITAVVVGVLVFHEHLTVRSIIDIVLIIIAVTVVVARKQQPAPHTEVKKNSSSVAPIVAHKQPTHHSAQKRK